MSSVEASKESLIRLKTVKSRLQLKGVQVTNGIIIDFLVANLIASDDSVLEEMFRGQGKAKGTA